MDSEEKAVVAFLIVIVGLTIYGIAITYVHWQADLAYERDLGGFFSYADEASDAKTKSDYFNQYVGYIESHNLTSGCDAVFFCEQPQSDLALKYKVLKSIQLRLNELKLLDEKDTAYQLGMTQITENEFPTFPEDAFFQGYMLERGNWGLALFP